MRWCPNGRATPCHPAQIVCASSPTRTIWPSRTRSLILASTGRRSRPSESRLHAKACVWKGGGLCVHIAHYMDRPQWVIACYGTFMFYLIGDKIVLRHLLNMKELDAPADQVTTMLSNLYAMVQTDTWLPSPLKLTLWSTRDCVTTFGLCVPDVAAMTVLRLHRQFWIAAQRPPEQGEPIADLCLQREVIDSSAETSEDEEEEESDDDEAEQSSYEPSLSEEDDDADDSDWEEPRKNNGKKKGSQQLKRGQRGGGGQWGQGTGQARWQQQRQRRHREGGRAQAARRSRFIGLQWRGNRQKWRGRLTVDGKQHTTEDFDEDKEVECARAYDRLARCLIGDGCLANFSEDGHTFLDPLGAASDDYRGVFLEMGRWFAQMKVHGKHKKSQTFDNTAEGKRKAAEAYDKLARTYHGARALCNFLPDGSRNAGARKLVHNTKADAAQRVAERNVPPLQVPHPPALLPPPPLFPPLLPPPLPLPWSSSTAIISTITGKRARADESDDDYDDDESAPQQQHQHLQQDLSGADAHDRTDDDAELMVVV